MTVITAVNGMQVNSWGDLQAALRGVPPGTAATISYLRDGRAEDDHRECSPRSSARRWTTPRARPRTVAALGVGLVATTPSWVTYGPVEAVGASGEFLGTLATDTVDALQRLPQKIPAAVDAVTGGERDIGHPDQRGRRQPARWRGRRATTPGRSSSSCSSR